MKVTITNEGFRCEITESGMEIWNSEKQIYSERFEVPATAEDIPNLVSQFNLFTSMRTVYTSESKVCIKRVVYYGGDLAQMQIVKDQFSDDWIVMFFDCGLNYIREVSLAADKVQDYVENLAPVVKGISGYVFRSNLGDCTNKGISSDHDRLYIVSDDGWSVLTDIRECVTVERRIIEHSEYVNVRPVYKADRWYMSGGNFLFSSDARFKEVTGVDYPVAIHDRYES